MSAEGSLCFHECTRDGALIMRMRPSRPPSLGAICLTVTIETLQTSAWPDDLRGRGYPLVEIEGGTRILPHHHNQAMEITADGTLTPATVGSTKPVSFVIHGGAGPAADHGQRDHGLRAVKCATCGRPDQPHEHGSKSFGALSANHPRKPFVPERVRFV